MEIVENIALISINATMIVQLVSFLVFMWLFNRLMIRPLRQVMREREGFVDKLRIKIAAADDDFKKVAEQIQRQENETRQTALHIREDIESAARQSALATFDQTKNEIGALREKAQQRINRSIADMRQQMQAEAEMLSDQMVAAILRQRSTR